MRIQNKKSNVHACWKLELVLNQDLIESFQCLLGDLQPVTYLINILQRGAIPCAYSFLRIGKQFHVLILHNKKVSLNFLMMRAN